jgi:hypothetical protein
VTPGTWWRRWIATQEASKMNADTYLAGLRKRNPKLFAADHTGKSPLIQIRLSELEKHLSMAFQAGELAGLASKSTWEREFGHKANEPLREQSLFEKIFGT